jgi:hypothetical protein
MLQAICVCGEGELSEANKLSRFCCRQNAPNEKPGQGAGPRCFRRPKPATGPLAAAPIDPRNAALQNVACRRMTSRLGGAAQQPDSQTALLLFWM